VPSAGFEPEIQGFKLVQTYALYRMAIGIGTGIIEFLSYEMKIVV
jgi:hypothetical protein